MSETKTHWKKLHNPDFLGAYSLDKDGSYIDLPVIIESVKNDVVIGQDGKKDECIVAKIKGNKPMILNATNCKKLTKLFNSPHIEDWAGKTVVVFVEKVKAFGDVHDALRIKQYFPPSISPDRALGILKNVNSKEEFTVAWKTLLSKEERDLPAVIAKRDELILKYK